MGTITAMGMITVMTMDTITTATTTVTIRDIEGFTSVSFQSDGPFSLRKFQNFLDNQMPQEVFRAKGVLWFNESERRHVFHLAGKRFSIDDTDWTGDRKNQLVLIGRDIDHTTLREQLQACVVH